MTTKGTKKASDPNKASDKSLGAYLNKLIYATIADLEAESECGDRYSPMKYVNYEYLTSVEDNDIKVENIFTMGDSVKQYLSFLLKQYISDIEEVGIEPNDTIETIHKNIVDIKFVPFSPFIFRTANLFRNCYGSTLTEANNKENWIYCQISGSLVKYATNTVTLALLAKEFDAFLKSLAYVIGRHIYRDKCALNEKFFEGVVCSLGLKSSMIDEMNGGLREKKVRAKPVKKSPGDTSASATIDTNTVTITTDVNTAVNNAVNTTEATNEVITTTTTTIANTANNIAPVSLNEDIIGDILNAI